MKWFFDLAGFHLVESLGTIVLLAFVIFFVVMVGYVMTRRKSHFDGVSQLPLDNDQYLNKE